MAGSPPVLKLESFPFKAAAWEHAGKDGRKYYSVSICKVYKSDKTGKWEETNSFFERELPAVAALALEMWRNLAVKEGQVKQQAAAPAAAAPPADEECPF